MASTPTTSRESAPDYSCAICLDSATDPVVTKCGHLYCWPCLDQWLEKQPECPTCKGAVNPDKAGDIIPLYGKGKQSAAAKKGPAPKAEASSSAEGAAADAPADQHGADGEHHEPPQQEDRPHAFNTRHERPRARREAPPPQNPRRHENNWGRNWGGGLFLFGAPTILTDVGMLPIIIIVCVAAFFIYKYWKERAANNAQRANNPAPQNNNNNNNNNNNDTGNGNLSFIPAIAIVSLAVLSIFLSTIAVDDETH